ncbi:MAG: DUF523 domain-containing protein [Magnetococcales bacterium]|nr:DUF523 domain-containing protein [Magnetococcales bacterium]
MAINTPSPAPERQPQNLPLRIGISGCLLGARVRYDGSDRYNAWLRGNWASEILFIPFCPETECGLGVPREPMRLEKNAENPCLRTLHTGIDHTHRLRQWSQAYIQQAQATAWAGCLLKSRSPSCGVANVTVFLDDTHTAPGRGLFAQQLLLANPTLPVAEGDLLQDAAAVQQFYDRVVAYAQTQPAVQTDKNNP